MLGVFDSAGPCLERVQALLGAKVNGNHVLIYAGNQNKCAHYQRAITGEVVKKKRKNRERKYVYYRCAGYTAKTASKASKRSQSLQEKWLSADGPTKRRLLEIVCLNFLMEGESLMFTLRKPFDLLADEAVLRNGRGDRTPVELFRHGVSEVQGKINLTTARSTQGNCRARRQSPQHKVDSCNSVN